MHPAEPVNVLVLECDRSGRSGQADRHIARAAAETECVASVEFGTLLESTLY